MSRPVPMTDELATVDRLDVLVAGDTHGNDPWLASLIELAATLRLRVMIQLGDFGYWEQSAVGRSFLDDAEARLAAAGILLLFLDGNHENHPLLRSRPVAADGTAHIRDHIRWMPRGHRFTLAGRRVGVLGGAFSVSWRSQTPGVDWFAEEQIQPDDLVLLGNEPLDILLTHEMPAGIPLVGQARIAHDDRVQAYLQRRAVADAIAATRPQLCIHGHWHTRYAQHLTVSLPDGTHHPVRVEGLGSDGDPVGGWAVLRLPAMTVIGRTDLTQRVLRPYPGDVHAPVRVNEFF